MKTNKLISLAVAVAIVPMVSSCLYGQKDVFDSDPASRMSVYLSDFRNILKSNDTWIMYYFPHQDKIYGGTVNFLSFTDEEVTAGGEIANTVLGKGSAYTETSLYKLTNDSGPVLSFDTRNAIIQYWGTPSGTVNNLYGESGNYQGHRGDFEFIIISATKDEIVLKGKRSGTYSYMYPFDGDTEEYLDHIESLKESFVISRHDGTVGTTPVEGIISANDRQMYFNYTDAGEAKEITAPFLFTDTGILLYNPVLIGGQSIQKFDFDTDSFVFTASDGASATLQGTTPEGWLPYEDFIGNFTFTYEKGTFDVTIEQEEYRKTLLIKGLNEHYDVTLTYNLVDGNVSILSQRLCNYNSSGDIWLIPWDSTAGYICYSPLTTGMKGTNSYSDENKLVVTFADNAIWKTYTVRGFLLRMFIKGEDPASGSNLGNINAATYSGWWFAGATNHQIDKVSKLEKK